tara:strand:- start:597 stop:1097 length:501 start_codon:yes stop_codon:yes gene_type:complete
MKTGSSNFEDDNMNQDLVDYAQTLITLFIIKATKIGTRYCVLSKRNTLTKEDIEYALKYQAIEFMKQTDIKQEIASVNDELLSLLSKDIGENNDELDFDDEFDDDELDEEIEEPEDPFKRVDIKLITEYDDILFVKKIHHYYEYWNQWKPSNYFEHKIKDAIDTMS